MGLAGRHLPIKWALRLYIPQEQSTNNAKNCFSWFLRGDTMRGQGEALSIREMVDHAVVKLRSDSRQVFVTGLSAGGTMASVMLATYPEIFAGGAILMSAEKR